MRIPLKLAFFFSVLVQVAGPLNAQSPQGGADAYTQAVQNADTRIEAYKQAVASGDAQAITEAALAVQKDPLAVQRVNQHETPEFKQRISNDVTAVRETAKADIKKELADHYGVHEDRISFLEATNPSADPKMGQDWDVTPQIDGMAVPLDVAAPAVQKAFHKAATGQEAATLDEAAHYTHEQSVEPINQSSAEAYGSGGKRELIDAATGEKIQTTEGGEIILGDKEARLRDPEHLGHVMEHKSDLAKNRADAKRAEGADADAVGWDMEQGRQYSKQEAKQIQTRVEARGGQVPDHVQKGNDILDQVASGEISPEVGRNRLAEMGETPESIIKKGTGLVEAADKLGTTPAERIAQAQAGETPKDVFVDSVKERMALKKLEREGAALKEGPRANLLDGEGKSSSAYLEETLPDTRAGQVRDRAARAAAAQGLDAPKSLLDGGKSSSSHVDIQGTVDTVMDTADWGGWAAEAVHKEEVAAAKENREFNKVNAAINGFKGLAAGQAFETFKKHGEAAKQRAESTGESKFLAGLSAWGSASAEFVHNALTGIYRMHESYQKEEMEKEIARAQKVGDKSDPWRAKIPALMRTLGDVLPVNKFVELWADDSLEALRAEAQMKIKLEARSKAAVEVGLAEFGGLERKLKQALLDADGSTSEEVLALQKEYHERMAGLQDLRNELRARGLIRSTDPAWNAINQSVDLLDPAVIEKLKRELAPALEDKAHVAAVRSALQSCKLDGLAGELDQIQVAETRAALTSEIEVLRAQIGAVDQLTAQAGQLASAGQLEDARNTYQQAFDRSSCSETRAAIQAALFQVQERIFTAQKIEAMKNLVAGKDCSGIQGSTPAWDPASETAICSCPDGLEMSRSGKYCRPPIAEQLKTKTCGPGAFPLHSPKDDVVTCECPNGYIRDYNSGIADMDQMPCIRLSAAAPSGGSYDPYSSPPTIDPNSYLTPIPDYSQQHAQETALFNTLRNMNNQAYGSGGGQGINLDQMYGNMASGGSSWSDPTNTASGGFYRPAGYTSYSSTGQAPAYSSYSAPPPPQSNYPGGPGQGEFSVNPGSGSRSPNDWCTSGWDENGCKPVQL